MGFYDGAKIVTSGLVLALDAGDRNSYRGSGTSWFDMTGNNRTATLVNGPVFSNTNGGNITLDGTNDYVSLGTTDMSITRDFTISFWMNISEKAGDVDVFNKGYNVPYGIYLVKLSTNRLSVQASLTSGFLQLDTVTTNYTGLKNWVAVRNNTNLFWYVNGALDTSSSGNSSNNVNQSVSKNWRIGANEEFTAGYLSGAVCSLLIYNTPLTANQVLQNYEAQKSRFGL